MLTERDILGAVAGGHDLDQTLVDAGRAHRLLVESWSFDSRPPSDGEMLKLITAADYELLRAAVLAELPDLQRAVHPSPGWRRR